MRATSLSGGNRRKGVILLVVLAMITLLTILGITFVLYSDASEATARISMEGEKFHQPDWTPDQLMQMAFGQLVFDVEDDEAGQRSGLRGHSLARDMYGYRYSGMPFTMGTPPPAGTGMGLNDRPFRGTGRFQADKYTLNFTTFYKNSGGSLVVDPATDPIRDPERLGPRLDPNVPNAYAGGFNPPYTYADLNHVFLAKLGLDGQVDEPSFVRREPMGTVGQPAPLGTFNGTSWDFTGAVWTDPAGKYRIVRPRPAENPQFPVPSDGWGDVRNLPWSTRNDAVWMDLGVEPRTANSGKKYKPLFAFTILDLDGRVNVNAHGNIHSRDGAGAINAGHASRDGTGPWEVSLARALSLNPGDTAWRNLFLGANGVTGRHKPDGTLSGIYATQNLFALNPQHTHGPLDGNSGQENALPMGISPQPLALPGAPMGAFVSPFGRFVAEVYGGMGPNEVTPFHEAMFHPFYDLSSGTPGNKLFGHNHLGLLMGRSVRSPGAWANSELARLGLFATDPYSPISTRDPRYDRLTTLSWDLDRPGMVPYLVDRPTQGVQLAPMTAWTPVLPVGGYPVFQPQVNFPAAGQQPFPTLPAAAPQGPLAIPSGATSEFDPFGQSQLALVKRLNLRRYLTTFPQLDPATGLYSDMTVAGQALLERQQFAQDIFLHLTLATGAMRPTDAGFPTMPGAATDPRYHATKWLAQLAANIVDYIDKDDVMTVFPWNNGQLTDLVVGVELSRLALNELYVQVENDPVDAGPGVKKATQDFRAKIYAELVNPLLSNVTPSNPTPDDDHSAVLKVGNQNVHVLEVVKPAAVPALRDISQKTGLIGNDHTSIPGAVLGQVTWDFPARIMPAGENFGAANGQGLAGGFTVVGPQPDNQASDLTNSRWTTAATAMGGDIIHKDMGFLIPKDTKGLNTLTQQDIPLVLLRRMAIPGMPLQEDPSKPNYNPYVTIDMAQITRQMLVDNDARKVLDGTQMSNPNPDKVDIGNRKAYGRSQPYFGIPAAAFGGNPGMQTYGTLIPQDPQNPVAGGPKCTFWRHNSRSDTAPAAFLPAVSYPFVAGGETFETPRFRPHLDRWPSSIGEILAVPTCRAHEVVMLNNHRSEFCAGWHEPTSRLYRFLELAQVGSVRNLQSASGPVAVGAEGGRVPGKINVNTMTFEVFKALCDAQPTTNRFTDAQVTMAWMYLQANRPYWGFGMGEAAAGDQLSGTSPRGMFQSIARRHPGFFNSGGGGVCPCLPADGTNANDPGDLLNLMLDAQNANNNGEAPPAVLGTSRIAPGALPELAPSVRHELLSKVIGNTTSRSNCFAVWVTVGFFEVVSEQGNPAAAAPKYILGQEMQPRTRRRMFALIDRTQLEAWRVPLQAGVAAIPANLADPMSGQLTTPVPVQLSNLLYQTSGGPASLAAGVMNGATGKLYPVTLGSVLTFDPGTIYEETTEVVDLGMGTLGVILRRPHGVGGPVVVCSRGNPGPVPRENIDLDDLKGTGLIPYFQVLE